MMSSVLNPSHCNHNQQFFEVNPQQPQFDDHLKCGEVYTWLCAGELYAVECKLCEDHPLCPLSEFPQHMEVWHTEWQHTHNNNNGDDDNEDDDNEDFEDYEEHNDEHALSFTTEDSGLFEPDDMLQNERVSNQVFLYNEELLEPFEQVLIEHDNTIDSIQIIVDVNEEECLAEVNKQVEEVADGVTETEHNNDHDFNINMTSKNQENKQIETSNALTENERKLPHLPTITESERELNVMKTKFITATENVQKKSMKLRKSTKITKDKSENETSKEETNSKSIESLKKSSNIERKGNKTSKLESDNSENETKSLKYFEKAKKTRKSLRNLNENKEELKDLKAITENEKLINRNKTKNKNSKRNFKKPKCLQKLKEKEHEISAIETISSKEKLEVKEIITNTFKYEQIPLKLPSCDDLHKSSKQNLANMRKSARNIRKNERNLQDLKENREIAANNVKNVKETQYFVSKKRKIAKYHKQLIEEEQEEMKQQAETESETNEIKIREKLPAFTNTSSNEIQKQKSFKTRTTTRNRRKLSNKFSKKSKADVQENLENYTKSLIFANLNYRRNRKSTNKLRKREKNLNSDETNNKNKLNIEEINGLQPQNFPKTGQSKGKLEKPTRLSLRSSKRKKKLTFNDSNLTADKRLRRESSCETTNILEEKLTTNFWQGDINVNWMPLSPNTEEEHFEIYEAKEKVSKHHVSYLIQLYQEHSHLWDQSHAKFCEPDMCRKSWQQITDQWNEFCKRKFSTAEVRIRLVTLCQRYVQERERLFLEGELDEFAKFPYYEQMQFLEQQKSLQQRHELQERQNEKILLVYQKFPILWHVSHYKVRQAKQRAEAFERISKTLKLSGLHLSSVAVQKRIRSLRKCYRLEKIRYLHAQVEQTPFEHNFRHYKRMQFLDKHVEPFRCRICGKIFENLLRFREHLEEENHGDVLQEDNENKLQVEEYATATTKDDVLKLLEYDKQDLVEVNEIRNEAVENLCDYQVHALIINNIEAETDKSCDILQTFTPLSCSPNPALDLVTVNLNLESLENHSDVIQEVLDFPCNTPAEPIIDSLNIADQLMEEIMVNVTNDDSFGKQSLDHFINSVTSCEKLSDNNVINEEIFNTNLVLGTHQTLFVASPQTTNELAELQETEHYSIENPSLTSQLVVNVQCTQFSVDFKLNPEPSEILKPAFNDSLPDVYSADISSIPLPDQEIHQMIKLYRKYPQIWNPNHLDYNSRNLRRQAWCTLTREFNSAVGKHFSWRTLHRKLTDYAKYYKKLITEQQDYEELVNKWTFYEDFKFLDDVIAVHDELQRSVHHRDNNFKIIKIYETLPQLWNIKHADYNKHSIKQRNIELMCNRLQEEHNLQLTSERLKNRLIELRAQYRAAKRQRLKCERNQQQFNTDFVFYEAFNFLDSHIDPFKCEQCNKEFKKLTDYNRHLKREHKTKSFMKLCPFSVLPLEPGVDKTLQNVCHICGIKFTTRSNLVHHVKRHEGIRNYECTMCSKKFFASHSLKVHIRSHTKECPYTCEKCGMSFVSASKLNQHIKRHLEKKDFECDYCSKRFYTGFEKDRHERRHLNIRDKVCAICGKTFVAGSSYYTHMMLHSDTKRFECDKCEMKFAQYAGLYKHKKRHHTT